MENECNATTAYNEKCKSKIAVISNTMYAYASVINLLKFCGYLSFMALSTDMLSWRQNKHYSFSCVFAVCIVHCTRVYVRMCVWNKRNKFRQVLH